MALQAGARLGPYEVLSLIGTGGMGEVYRGRDTRLDRIVAIKILTPALASDAEFRARFTGEAKAISALNHPHICGLFDIGHQEGIDFLVMEYLDGETLGQRLGRGKIPLDHAVQNGIQIADALAAAHKAGIIHRDVKPGNVLLTRSGLKLLDFGLAKTAPPILHRAAETGRTELTTQAHLTGEGTIVGTLEYMAPEQLEGKELDPRTDIFALGAILYEMVTGRKAFKADSQASLITAIMSSEPPRLVSVAPMTPPLLDRLIHTCLAKNPDDRVQTAQDVLLQLRWILEGSQLDVTIPRATRRLGGPVSRAWVPWTITAVVALAAVWLLLARARSGAMVAHTPSVVRSTILLPERVTLNNAVISPDGSRVVFSGRDRAGRSQLWVRALAADAAVPLAGTEDGILPFWSPDGRHIAFFTAFPNKALKRIEASGGAPLSLLQETDGMGGAWTSSGDILFSTPTGPILRIPAAGGQATPITKLDASRGETGHRYPFMLPDGRHFLFLAMKLGGSLTDPANRICVGSLDAGQAKPVLPASFNAQYADGYLLFLRGGAWGGSLLAQPFDPTRLEITGTPAMVAEHVALYGDFIGLGSVSVASSGALLFDGSRLHTRLEWYDRAGRQIGSFGEPAIRVAPRLSFDGSRVLFNKYDPGNQTSQVWIADVPRGLETRLTSAPGNNTNAIWSPDGTRVAYQSDAKHQGDIHIRLADGSGSDNALTDEVGQYIPTDWSSDGRVVVAVHREPLGERLVGISAFSLEGDRKAVAVVPPRATDIVGASLSLDRRWLAYATDESGRLEVYVVSFPDGRGKVQISNAGGCCPKWTRNGHELLYRAPSQQVMSVGVDNTKGFRAGTPAPLFAVPEGADGPWDAAADGQRFVFTVPALKSSSVSLSLVLNWAAGLKR